MTRKLWQNFHFLRTISSNPCYTHILWLPKFSRFIHTGSEQDLSKTQKRLTWYTTEFDSKTAFIFFPVVEHLPKKTSEEIPKPVDRSECVKYTSAHVSVFDLTAPAGGQRSIVTGVYSSRCILGARQVQRKAIVPLLNEKQIMQSKQKHLCVSKLAGEERPPRSHGIWFIYDLFVL